MAQKIDEAYIELTIRDKKLRKGLKDTEAAVTRTGATMKKMAGAFAGAFAVRGAIGFMKESAEAALIQEDAMAKLEGVLKATGGAAGISAKALGEYAAELQNSTTFGDELTISAAGVLATFDKIGGETFKGAISTAQDMSVAFGTDLRSSMLQLGKALNDPLTGLTALNRVGVSFSKTTRDQVKDLVEQNKLYEAQEIILKGVRAQVGGVAAEMAKTRAGQIAQMTNAWGDMKEEIGFAVMALIDFKETTAQVKNITSLLSGKGFADLGGKIAGPTGKGGRRHELLDTITGLEEQLSGKLGSGPPNKEQRIWAEQLRVAKVELNALQIQRQMDIEAAKVARESLEVQKQIRDKAGGFQ